MAAAGIRTVSLTPAQARYIDDLVATGFQP